MARVCVTYPPVLSGRSCRQTSFPFLTVPFGVYESLCRRVRATDGSDHHCGLGGGGPRQKFSFSRDTKSDRSWEIPQAAAIRGW